MHWIEESLSRTPFYPRVELLIFVPCTNCYGCCTEKNHVPETPDTLLCLDTSFVRPQALSCANYARNKKHR